MIGRTSRDGTLEVKRDGRWRPQYCPYRTTFQECGRQCPLFQENEGHVVLACARIRHEIDKES